ncbi:hypothetical protein KCH_65470 [Kitasatospora cheerisanensis KCTC 2395]|uniref:Uncharacterized protein n=1 Tax=Kitasatospora cheerisanensis KCTC 2395 TaxID=1348663 RepID=A0A066YKZ6_9ACTN|nr:hypothetical protein KCH_65470 [Kitasatospora cheerisanensis KCTC 2395]
MRAEQAELRTGAGGRHLDRDERLRQCAGPGLEAGVLGYLAGVQDESHADPNFRRRRTAHPRPRGAVLFHPQPLPTDPPIRPPRPHPARSARSCARSGTRRPAGRGIESGRHRSWPEVDLAVKAGFDGRERRTGTVDGRDRPAARGGARAGTGMWAGVAGVREESRSGGASGRGGARN